MRHGLCGIANSVILSAEYKSVDNVTQFGLCTLPHPSVQSLQPEDYEEHVEFYSCLLFMYYPHLPEIELIVLKIHIHGLLNVLLIANERIFNVALGRMFGRIVNDVLQNELPGLLKMLRVKEVQICRCSQMVPLHILVEISDCI